MAKVIVTKAEQAYARMLLTYLHNHYSKSISTNDPYLIYAIAAWLHAADKEWPNRLKLNNPLGVRDQYGELMKFGSIKAGIIGAARMLIYQSKPNWVTNPYGGQRVNTHNEMALFKGALNALKHGGNTGGSQFLMWLAYTSWSPSHYGWNPGEDVAKPENNRLIKWYISFGGMETTVTKRTVKKVKLPAPARDLNVPITPMNYLDPWAVKAFYEATHKRIPVLPGLDDIGAEE